MPASATLPTAAATSNESIATGPTASFGELPNSAYTSGGAIAAYSPTTGGSPASSA